MDNKAFQRALNGLSHPATLIALLLMAINDFILKPLASSWLTGKLSDMAWLVIAPLVAAAILALIMPRRAEKSVLSLSMIVCGGLFIALKITGTSNHAILDLASRLTGIVWATSADPGDLIALPALLVPWAVWRQADSETAARRSGWAAVAVAALALIGDAAAPYHAISCLSQDGDRIIAYDNYSPEVYSSSDGGMTWQTAPPDTSKPQGGCVEHHSWEISQPGDDQVRYRLMYGEGIERSADGGKNWQRDFSLNDDKPRTYYLRKFVAYDAGPGPYSAIFDSRTGNLVVAAGYDGALVRDAGGTWKRVAVGPYHYEDLTTSQIIELLSGEIKLAVLLVFLTFPFLDRIGIGFRRRDIALAILGWLPWAAGVILAPADISKSGDYIRGPMLDLGILFSALIAIIWLIINKTWKLRLTAILRGVGISLLGGALFVTPFLLWGEGILDHYQTAQIAALAAVIVVLGISIFLALRSREDPPEHVDPA